MLREPRKLVKCPVPKPNLPHIDSKHITSRALYLTSVTTTALPIRGWQIHHGRLYTLSFPTLPGSTKFDTEGFSREDTGPKSTGLPDVWSIGQIENIIHVNLRELDEKNATGWHNLGNRKENYFLRDEEVDII